MRSRSSSYVRFGLLSALAASIAACAVGASLEGDEPVAEQSQAVHDEGLFEIDGDAVNGPEPGDDWSNVLLLGGTSGAIVHTGVVVDPPDGSIFTTGGSKDINDITQWRHKSGAVPDKDDISDAYAAAYVAGQDLIIYFGADRVAVSGDSQLGFWFFKNDVSLNANGTFNGAHAIGDILVLSDFTQGGAIGTVKIFEWVGSGGSDGALNLLDGGAVLGVPGANLFCLPDDNVCASINNVTTESPWNYVPKGSTTDQPFPPGAFFEGGVNITQLVPGNTCFSSFMAETRSSQSPTATLKDFDLGNFDTCAISVTKTCDVAHLNPPGSSHLFTATYSGTVTNSGVSALPTGTEITVVDDAGTPGNTIDDDTQIITLTAPLLQGASVSFSGTFQTNLNPPTNTVTATAQVNQNTVIAAAPYSVACKPLPLNPHLLVEKSCETELDLQGGMVVVKIGFAGQVCNDGEVPLTVNATDDHPGVPTLLDNVLIGPGLCVPFQAAYYPSTPNGGVLDPSSAMFSDTVTAVGTNPALPEPVTAMATATCKLCPCL
jgi:hypothetical protein